ncbi:DUF5317 domain-containing protein [Gudongella sp. SC589]|uniref:DUF5317 domain-containing protein n=1 Tax=Gudongella sp. SC589 TaxID=3385990 RepID=UPI003904AD92
MIVETLLLAILYGKLKGGKLSNLSEISIDMWGFIPASFLLSYTSIYLITKGNSFLLDNFAYIQLASNFLLLMVLFYNRKIWPYNLVSAGIILNTLPMALNGGRMPVSEWALKKSGLLHELVLIADNRIVTHTILLEDTSFKIFSDIIPLIYKVISIGDLLIAAGIFLIILKYMTSSQPLQRR